MVTSTYEQSNGGVAMGTRELKRMSLTEAVASQPDTSFCFECGSENGKKLMAKPLELYGVTVLDFPVYQCERCGAESHRASVSVAVEHLQQKHKLHGGYYIDDLLKLEKHQTAHP